MITQNLPAYVYVQYQGDDNISAFFDSYNEHSQTFLDRINDLNLPIYYTHSGKLLNFTANGIYGIIRQDLPVGGPRPLGPLNTFTANQETPNHFKYIANSNSYAISDLAFQRIIQWNIFKGDGYQFTLLWLKRRIIRFLTGTIFPDNTYAVSVTFTGETAVLISITDSFPLAPIVQAGITSGVLQLPFQYTYTVDIA